MDGFTDTQLEQLRALFAEERAHTASLISAAVNASEERLRSEIRTEVHAAKAELRSEIHAAKDEVRSELHAVKNELRAEIRDANHQRREDDDLLLERIKRLETAAAPAR